ncbi:5-hydroxytryptamine receptor-like [Diadema antillarum]|uniref:5-hydroxytryptamine receptor-like n=1 Tax=Diadema antillarum TaxID=105358 RepID=UPI003A8A5B11
MVAAFFTNILAMTQILTSPKLRRNYHNLLIVNLNVIDLGITLFSMTFSVAAIFDNGYLLTNNATVCTINGFFAITCSVGNFTNVMCVAIDRYLSIVWSIQFPPTRRRMVIMVAFIWTVSITITLPPTFQFLSEFEYTPHTHHCSPKWDVCSYYAIWFTVIFGITIPVMIICYVCVIYYIRKTEKQLLQYDSVKTAHKVSRTLTGSSSVSSQNSAPERQARAGGAWSFSPHVQSPRSKSKSSSRYVQRRGERQAVQMQEGLTSSDVILNDIRVIIPDSRDSSSSGGTQPQQPFSVSRLVSQRHDHVICSDDQRQSSQGELASGEGAQREQTAEGRRSQSARKKMFAHQRRFSREKKVAMTGAMLVLTTILCWAPYNIIHFCYFPIKVNHSVAAATMWIAYFNALLDPLIYVFMNRKESTVKHLVGILSTCRAIPDRIRKSVRRARHGSDW